MGNFVLYRNGKNFNPRTPYGMRRVHKRKIAYTVEFQSTHPLRDATVDAKHALFMAIISIHAPLTGCDIRRTRKYQKLRIFQSTHPLRDATIVSLY